METRSRALLRALAVAGMALTAPSCGGDDERLPPVDASPADVTTADAGPDANLPDGRAVDGAPDDADNDAI